MVCSRCDSMPLYTSTFAALKWNSIFYHFSVVAFHLAHTYGVQNAVFFHYVETTKLKHQLAHSLTHNIYHIIKSECFAKVCILCMPCSTVKYTISMVSCTFFVFSINININIHTLVLCALFRRIDLSRFHHQLFENAFNVDT